MEEMALAFQKEMERAALEDELTATPEEREEQELEATETSSAEEAATKATPDEENEEVSPVERRTDEHSGEQEQETITPSETIALLQGSTKRDLSDEEFYKLEKLLKYNAKKRGVSVKSADADARAAQKRNYVHPPPSMPVSANAPLVR